MAFGVWQQAPMLLLCALLPLRHSIIALLFGLAWPGLRADPIRLWPAGRQRHPTSGRFDVPVPPAKRVQTVHRQAVHGHGNHAAAPPRPPCTPGPPWCVFNARLPREAAAVPCRGAHRYRVHARMTVLNGEGESGRGPTPASSSHHRRWGRELLGDRVRVCPEDLFLAAFDAGPTAQC